MPTERRGLISNVAVNLKDDEDVVINLRTKNAKARHDGRDIYEGGSREDISESRE